MILKLVNEQLDCYEYFEKVTHLRKYSGHFKVKQMHMENPPNEVTPAQWQVCDLKGQKALDAKFMFDPSIAEAKDWNVKLLSFHDGEGVIFIAYMVGYLLNDEGKTIENLT